MSLKDLLHAGFSARQARAVLATAAAGGGGGGGGGSSAFGGTTTVNNINGAYTVTALTGGQRVAFNDWNVDNYVNAHPGPAITLDNANFQWTPTLAGWYQISWNLNLEFSADPPASARFEVNGYNDAFGMDMDLPVFGADFAQGNGRLYPGYQGRLTSNIFYTDDAATVLNYTGIKPFLLWAGTPTIGRLFLTAEISKLG